MRRLGGQLDGVGVHRAAGPCDSHGLTRDLGRGLGSQVDPGREAPGPVDHDADRETELGGLAAGLDATVAQPDALLAQALEAEVGVTRAEALRCGQRGFGKNVTGEGKEFRGY